MYTAHDKLTLDLRAATHRALKSRELLDAKALANHLIIEDERAEVLVDTPSIKDCLQLIDYLHLPIVIEVKL